MASFSRRQPILMFLSNGGSLPACRIGPGRRISHSGRASRRAILSRRSSGRILIGPLFCATRAVVSRRRFGSTSYGGGIEEPYQRTGSGTGAGWQNEFETIRIRLTDFQALVTTPVDLSNIVAVRFQWGGNTYSVVGRIALDDIEVTIR